MIRLAFSKLSQVSPGLLSAARFNSGFMRILVVDDDRGIRESLRRSLEFNGYTVELARDGEQAMDAVARQRPDAMVLDVTMPRVDGLEVCRRLRSAGDDLPVLVLTARDAASDRVTGLDAGADDYLPKPFLPEELLARLRALLRRSTFEKPRNPGAANPGAALTFVDSPSARETDLCRSPIEASVGRVKRVASSLSVKRTVGRKARLTAKIIGVASVIVAIIGLIPAFAGAFWTSDVRDSKVSHSDTTTCPKVRKMYLVNGAPEMVNHIEVDPEVRVAGQGYTYWLVLTLVLVDGSVLLTKDRFKRFQG
jgi:two-component system response regulator MprA